MGPVECLVQFGIRKKIRGIDTSLFATFDNRLVRLSSGLDVSFTYAFRNPIGENQRFASAKLKIFWFKLSNV